MAAKKTKADETTKTFTVVESNYLKKGYECELKLRDPSIVMANKIQSFFKNFRNVVTDFDLEDRVVYIYSTDYDLTEALNRFIVRKHELGKLKLEVKVVDVGGGEAEVLNPPSWTITDKAMLEKFKYIFKGSPMAPDFTSATDPTGTTWSFFEFPNYAITYQADALTNLRGFESCMVADAVKELFAIPVGYQISTYACE